MAKDTKVNCLYCGHRFNLDAAYDDYEGLVTCDVCALQRPGGGLMEVRIVEGLIKSIKFATLPGEGAAPAVTINAEEYLKKGSAV